MYNYQVTKLSCEHVFCVAVFKIQHVNSEKEKL